MPQWLPLPRKRYPDFPTRRNDNACSRILVTALALGKAGYRTERIFRLWPDHVMGSVEARFILAYHGSVRDVGEPRVHNFFDGADVQGTMSGCGRCSWMGRPIEMYTRLAFRGLILGSLRSARLASGCHCASRSRTWAGF